MEKSSKTNKDLAELDLNAKRIGIGGNLAPEANEEEYKKRMQERERKCWIARYDSFCKM